MFCFLCVGFVFAFLLVFLSFFLHQFGGVTNKLQTKICQLRFTTQHSHSHTPAAGPWQLPLSEEMITPLQRQAVPLCLEEKKELKIKIQQQQQTQKHRWEGTGWWPYSPGETSPHMCDSRFAPDCHKHKHTSTALPFAQANTHREWLSIKGFGGGQGVRSGVYSRQRQCHQGGGPAPLALPALAGLPWSPGCGQRQLGCGEGLRRAGRSWGQ